MKIAIIPNKTKERAEACTQEIQTILTQCGCSVVVKTDLFTPSGNRLSHAKDSLEDCDILIAVGGDGTIIHTAKLAASLNKPILGVNAGKLGFTAGLELQELSLLPRLLRGEYQTEERTMLTVTLHSPQETRSFCAMNDAVVSGELAKIIDYALAPNGKTAYRYRADGFIVATPTGSTAYSLSAGGPVVEPTIDCMVYTPICPHSLFNRSVIFSLDTVLHVTIAHSVGKVYLTVDGEQPQALSGGDRLEFARASRTARFILLGSQSFYDTLHQKIL